MIQTDVVLCEKLTELQKREMFALMEMYYDNLNNEAFLRDLSDKTAVLLAFDVDRQKIVGFTTFKFYGLEFKGQWLDILYSGDTVVHNEYWGQIQLASSFMKVIRDCLDCKKGEVYWFLLSKGVRTYRFMPLYFRDFYPRSGVATPPWESAILDHLASERFGSQYIASKGVVRFSPPMDYLKSQYCHDKHSGKSDLHEQFFLEANPGYEQGDNLCCLARLSEGNLRPKALAWLKGMSRHGIS